LAINLGQSKPDETSSKFFEEQIKIDGPTKTQSQS
jgi:hypothetical protein